MDHNFAIETHWRTTRHLLGRASAYLNGGNVDEAAAMLRTATAYLGRTDFETDAPVFSVIVGGRP